MRQRKRYALVGPMMGAGERFGRSFVYAVASSRDALQGRKTVSLHFCARRVPRSAFVVRVPKGCWARPGHDADIRSWLDAEEKGAC